jgi:hypothetical protein
MVVRAPRPFGNFGIAAKRTGFWATVLGPSASANALERSSQNYHAKKQQHLKSTRAVHQLRARSHAGHSTVDERVEWWTREVAVQERKIIKENDLNNSNQVFTTKQTQSHFLQFLVYNQKSKI